MVCTEGCFGKTILVIVSCISSFLVWYHRVTPSILFDEISVEMSVKQTKVGYISAMFFIGYAIIQPLVPWVTSHISPSHFVGISTIISAIGCCLFAFSKSFSMSCLSRFIIGLGCGPVAETLNTILASWFDASTFTTLQGLLLVFGACGGIFAQGPLSSILDKSEWRLSFYIVAGISAVIGILHIIIRATTKDNDNASLEATAPTDLIVAQNLIAEDVDTESFSCATLSSKQFWGATIYLSFASAVFFNFCSAWAGPYLMQYYSYSNIESGYLQMTLLLGFIIGVFAFGFLLDLIWKRRLVLIIANVIALILVLEFTFLKMDTSNVLVFTAMFFLGFATMGPVPVALSMLKDIDPTGVILSVANLSMNLVTALLQVVVSCVATLVHGEEARDMDFHEFQVGLWIPSAVCIGLSFIGLFLLDESTVLEPV